MVVAGGAWETPRLLLRSEIANSSGLVGRYLMYHFQTFVIGSFPFRLHGHRGRSVTHLHDDHMIIDDDVPRLRHASTDSPTSAAASSSTAAAAARSWKASTPRPASRTPARCSTRRCATGCGRSPCRAKTCRRSTNRIDLDPHGPRRVRLPGRARDLRRAPARGRRVALLRAEARRRSCARPAPSRRSSITSPPLEGDRAGTRGASMSRHIMGTCRMGDDPAHERRRSVAALPRRREHGVHRLVGVPDLDRLRPDAHDRRARDPRVPRPRRACPQLTQHARPAVVGSARGSRRPLRHVARRRTPARRTGSATSGTTSRSCWCSSDTSVDCTAASMPRSCASATTRSQSLGADIVAIGTGDQRYAEAFVRRREDPVPRARRRRRGGRRTRRR